MNIFIEIQRFNPEKDKEPYLQTYEVRMEKTQRILDALMHIVRNIEEVVIGTGGCQRRLNWHRFVIVIKDIRPSSGHMMSI